MGLPSSSSKLNLVQCILSLCLVLVRPQQADQASGKFQLHRVICGAFEDGGRRKNLRMNVHIVYFIYFLF